MKRSRAMDTLRGLDPAGGAPESPDSPQAQRMLASVMAAEGGAPPRSPRRGRAGTFALVAVIAVAAGFGLWKAFGPVLSSSKEHHVGHSAAPTTGPAVTPPATTTPTHGADRAAGAAAVRGHDDRAAVRRRAPEICVGVRTLPAAPVAGADGCRSRTGTGTRSGASGAIRRRASTRATSRATTTSPARSTGRRSRLPTSALREPPPDSEGDFTVPCETPSGGWIAPDPSRTGQVDLQKANRLAAHEPDYAGLWVHYVVAPGNDGSVGPDDMVITAAFTGDLGRHRQELEQVWGGPLCVVRFDHSQDELLHIQNQLTQHRRGGVRVHLPRRQRGRGAQPGRCRRRVRRRRDAGGRRRAARPRRRGAVAGAEARLHDREPHAGCDQLTGGFPGRVGCPRAVDLR